MSALVDGQSRQCSLLEQAQRSPATYDLLSKWFARRPGTLFRGLLLAEFVDKPLREAFYESNQLNRLKIGDPFMGGGTPLMEANRLGCDVVGFDINPMAYWIVKQEIEHLNLGEYVQAATSLREQLAGQIGCLYRTRCVVCGKDDANVKYFLWVKTVPCPKCDNLLDLFPGYLLASKSRHPKNVFLCHACGQLTETDDRKAPGVCQHCGDALVAEGPARGGRCGCPTCGTVASFPNRALGPPKHRLFAIEYHCTSCKDKHSGRFFKTPDSLDFDKVARAERMWARTQAAYVPEDKIPSGDETNRLHRWGYERYREMFNPRQLTGLELSARIIVQTTNGRIRDALSTNLSDLLRYQNMLCRYDTDALKSLDVFSVHGFPVGLVQCESNLLGILESTRRTCIGSGGWANITEKYRKAKEYCDSPFEVRHHGLRKEILPIKDEWIGDYPNGAHRGKSRTVDIRCSDAAREDLPRFGLDAVFTDPPYFGNVQYAELMDFCYVWLRRLVGAQTHPFSSASTRNPQELTGNEDMGWGLDHFANGLSCAFQKMARALKTGSPLAFTYHHNSIEAYYPIAVAVLDSGLTCSASLPCPAEMGASIHIKGTGSSIIDTVFVCRSTGKVPRKWVVDSPDGIAGLVKDDLDKLRAGNVKPTIGDVRCIAYGHMIRIAIWNLRGTWNRNAAMSERLSKVSSWLSEFGGWEKVEKLLSEREKANREPTSMLHENTTEYGDPHAEVSF